MTNIPEDVYATLKEALAEYYDNHKHDPSTTRCRNAGEAVDWIENLKNKPRVWKVGDEIHGFANGYFGRDSYHCRRVEVVGSDYLILRNTRNEVEKISIADANQIHDPMDLSDCERSAYEECLLRKGSH